MPLIVNDVPTPPVDAEVLALRKEVARLQRIVDRVWAELAEPGPVTRWELERALTG